ncbi:MAG: sigma-70 family RNA polymerase sigma factor [Nostoc sp. NMS7]|uniref:sigma-70 family RNA polymerase sigma factor n=1 Tax=Nostoc sp. NMS7 TaxID=2815391 RepID=UPI0025FE724F|nr:sigma-70 family RNA polymerase sigma factor [Nostoc sp. NMS7]MBN3947949.1 sigma-70 family RNA polymerase sigma factor [Nostoc sp. NMS7]
MESHPPPHQTDTELLHALKAKQPGALSILYDRYGQVVYGIALKVLQNPQEAEDLTQEIFLALWRNPTVNPNHSHFLRYLITMTRSRAIDKIRSRSRTLNLLHRFGQTVTAETLSPTPVEQAELIERQAAVRSALSQLPDNQRQIIEMAYDAGLSQSEIAQQLDVPLGTVKTWTRQGLLKLKQILLDAID